jgi:hypothetical protein
MLNDGLKFIPTSIPHDFAEQIEINAKDFNRRALTLNYFEQNPPRNKYNYNPLFRLKTASSWIPPDTLFSSQIKKYYNNFTKETKFGWDSSNINSRGVNLSRSYEIRALKLYSSLKTNKSIVINNADKNAGLTIMDTSTYIRHMRLELAKPQYQRYHNVTPEALLSHLQFEETSAIRDLFNSYGALTKQQKTFLSQRGTRNNYIYILFKHHKPKINDITWKTRPIISNVKAPFQNISIFSTYILQKLIKPGPSILKNSFSLVETLKTLELQADSFLFTIDYAALYTNISLNRLYTALTHFNIPIAIQNLLKNTFNSTYFTFGNEVYKQTDGIKMGSNEAVILANLYLEYYTDNIVQCTPNLLLYRRYIDDIFGIWTGTYANFLNFIIKLKNCTPELSIEYLTSEKSINFLDLTISIKPQDSRSLNNRLPSIEFSLYSKETSSFQYIPPYSQHSPGHFKGFIIGELTRINRLNSSDSSIYLNRQLLWNRLLQRGYKPSYLSNIFSTTRQDTPINDLTIVPFKVQWNSDTPRTLINEYVKEMNNLNLTTNAKFITCYTTASNLSQRIATFSLTPEHFEFEN